MDRFSRRDRWYTHRIRNEGHKQRKIHEKLEDWRARTPLIMRSKYEHGGEVPFQTVWRAVLLEFIATCLFVFFACGSVIAANAFGILTAAAALLAATAQGFAIACLVYAISHTSGGHINPAVTFALIVSNNMGIIRGAFYVVAQISGGITGAALLYGVTDPDRRGNIGTTELGSGTSMFQALVFEFIITFSLIFTIFGTAINKAGSTSGTHSLAPLPIGFAVLIGVIVAYSTTGGSMNPARTLGPALISGTWGNHWIYWVGPLGAAFVVGLLERYVLLVIPPARQPAIAAERHAEDLEHGIPAPRGDESAAEISPMPSPAPARTHTNGVLSVANLTAVPHNNNSATGVPVV